MAPLTTPMAVITE